MNYYINVLNNNIFAMNKKFASFDLLSITKNIIFFFFKIITSILIQRNDSEYLKLWSNNLIIALLQRKISEYRGYRKNIPIIHRLLH